MPDNSETPDWQTRRDIRRQQRRNARGLSCGQSPASRLILAVALIVAGVFLFLDNLGVLRLRNIWAYSPLLLVAWGVSVFSGARSITKRYWGVVLIVFGGLGLLLNLGLLRLHTRDDSWLLALLLIALGFLALIRTIEGSTVPRPPVGFPTQTETRFDNVLNEHTVAGSIKRWVETPNFQGGKIECVFGSVELDLRRSQIAAGEKPATIDVNCVFGSTKLRIPETWMVNVQAAGIFGSVEDKTIPPRGVSGLTPALLIINGQSVFGSVEVEN